MATDAIGDLPQPAEGDLPPVRPALHLPGMTHSSRTRLFLPRLLATASAVLSVILWVRLAWMTAVGPGGAAVPPAVVAALLFPGLAVTGALAAYRDAPLVTFITGLIGLLPVGLYFLPAPGVLRLIGLAPLMMLLAGVLLIRDLRARP